MYALNFYSPMVADQLRSGRKTATIRLGDKSRKYRKGMIVQVLAGTRFSPRQKIFDAVIDKVEVKTLADLSPREIEHDNPEIRRPEEMAGFLGQLYNREVADDELVTVIRFSEIRSAYRLLVLSREVVERAARRRQLLERLERAFVELSAGRASVPPRVAAFAPAGLLGAMPGYVDGVLAAKLVALFPDHEPSHQALIAVFDAETGTPLAVMDGTHITAVRTGASSAVATRALAREDARVLAVLGAGVQGRSHLDAVRRVRDFEEIRVASRTFEHAAALAEETGATAVESFEEAVRGADVVCCCTHAVGAGPAARDGSRPGTHVTSVGAALDGPGARSGDRSERACSASSRASRSRRRPAGSFELQGLDPRAGGRARRGARAARGPAARATSRSRSTSRWATRSRTPRRPRSCSSSRRILTPNCSGGRSSPPHASHSTANAEAKRAPQLGHCERNSPPHCGHAAGSSSTYSSKYRWTNPQRRQNATQSPSVLRRSSCSQFRARLTSRL